MRLSVMGPLTVIKWGRRLIYLVIFISLIVVYGNWHNPRTYTFLGSILCLLIPLLFLLKDEDLQEKDDRAEARL